MRVLNQSSLTVLSGDWSHRLAGSRQETLESPRLVAATDHLGLVHNFVKSLMGSVSNSSAEGLEWATDTA